MEGRLICFYACLCVYFFADLSCAARSIPEPSFADSRDVIMKEDAEEVFYDVNLEKYDDLGVHCPEPEPPEHGALKGEDGKNRVGSVIYVVCKRGFRLQGPTVMQCVPTGEGAEWNPQNERRCVEGMGHFQETQNRIDKEENEDNQADKAPSRGFSNFPMPASPYQNLGGDRPEMPPYLDTRVHRSWVPSLKLKDVFEHVPENEARVEESKIMSDTPSFCLSKPDQGPCKAYFERYYFSKETNECKKFIYGGCQGNENNFESEKECNLTCLGRQ